MAKHKRPHLIPAAPQVPAGTSAAPSDSEPSDSTSSGSTSSGSTPSGSTSSGSTPSESPGHVPVLLGEIVQYRPTGRATRLIVDATVGSGGHAAALLEAAGPDAQLIGLDADPGSLRVAAARLEPFGPRVRLLHRRFGSLNTVLRELGVAEVDYLIADLGLNSRQIAAGERGFSFGADGPLDMRFDPTGELAEPGQPLLSRAEGTRAEGTRAEGTRAEGTRAEVRRAEGSRGQPSGAPRGREKARTALPRATAAEIVNGWPEAELADLIYRLGEERLSRRIARAILEARRTGPLTRAAELADVIRGAYPAGARRQSRIDPATRTFQALRIAVNDELGQLEALLAAGPSWLSLGGRMAVISFHSLEDRPVKQQFRRAADDQLGARRFALTVRKPVTAAEAELSVNPRSRSAKLRVLERTG